MPNYAVVHQRPAKSLLKLRDELNAVFPNRFTGTDGFISGYGQFNKTGHNPNNLGHTMAFDISTPANGEHITEAEGRALAEYFRSQMNRKFWYLIHDQGAGAPEPMIAGNHTKDFSWARYEPYYDGSGGDAHSNHIHISLTADYFWGDPCGLAQEIYDDESSWGIAEFFAGKKPPVVVPPTTSGKTINQLVDEVNAGKHGNGDARKASLGKMYDAVQAEINRRAGVAKPPAPKPVVKTTDQLVDEVQRGLHGNGDARVKSLGSRYTEVQNEINRRAGQSSVNISALADAVMRGDYGDGADRQRRLGVNYAAVQAEINRRYS